MQDERLAQVVEGLKRVLSPEVLRSMGKGSGLVRRSRCITAERLVPSLIRSLGARKVASLAELARDFNADHGTEVFYKPFYERLDAAGFPSLMQELFSRMLSCFRLPALQSTDNSVLREFDDVWIQDGTSFALHPALREAFPGRFTDKSPAAVELHCTMSLFEDRPVRLAISPDSTCERHFLPDPAELCKKLLLADRGYDSTRYLEEVDAHGGSFVVRLRKSGKPRVVTIHGRGKKFRRLEGAYLDEVLRKAPRDTVMDMDVCWEEKGQFVRPARIVAVYNPAKRHWVRLITNLCRERFSPAHIQSIYRLRWQIELLFKELKSHANLHYFVTRKPKLAEGLIWASLAGAVLKRFLATCCQWFTAGVAISTQKTAKCAATVLTMLLPPLCAGKCVLRPLAEVFRYLGCNALRSNVSREIERGRLNLGLLPAKGAA